MLGKKAIENRLNKYFETNFGEDANAKAQWYVNPSDNQWKFKLGSEVVTLECDVNTGKVKETRIHAR